MVTLNILDIARNCYAASKSAIEAFDVANGMEQLDFVGIDKTLKGKHRVDATSEKAIGEYIATLNSKGFGPYNLFFESKSIRVPNAIASIFVDEVDGSLNMERKTGNPSFIFGYSKKIGDDIKLNEFEFVLVKSYLTGDEYIATKGDGAKFIDHRTGQVIPIVSSGPEKISDAVAYLRTGYGKAAEQLSKDLPLHLNVKDIRAFDNTGIELCELARGAAHLIADFRGVSDTQNLIPYLIIKEAGGEIVNENGGEIGDENIIENRTFNFIAASNKSLLEDVKEKLKDYEESGLKEKAVELIDEIKNLKVLPVASVNNSK